MMRPAISVVALTVVLAIAACAQPGPKYIPSQKSAVELRVMQTRVVPAVPDVAMRDVIETMQDLGYRITQASQDAGTVSGTRAASLRLAAIVQPRGPDQSAVRANASIVSLRGEAQVDSPAFYRENFFEPLGATMGRTLTPIDASENVPEAPRPVAEINTAAEREAKAREKAAKSE